MLTEDSVQEAMNMLRAVLFGDGVNLSGAIKDEPTRLLVASKVNELDRAIDRFVLDALDEVDALHATSPPSQENASSA